MAVGTSTLEDATGGRDKSVLTLRLDGEVPALHETGG
jgi:hypothetical protein